MGRGGENSSKVGNDSLLITKSLCGSYGQWEYQIRLPSPLLPGKVPHHLQHSTGQQSPSCSGVSEQPHREQVFTDEIHDLRGRSMTMEVRDSLFYSAMPLAW